MTHPSIAVSLEPGRLTRRNLRGVTLIELLIGISIGLLVTLAALGTMTFTRITTTTVSDTVRMQQDASVVFRMIGQQIRQARSIALQQQALNADVTIADYAPYTGVTPPGAPREVAVYGVEGGVSDAFTVSFSLSPVDSRHCMGFATVAPVTNTVFSSFDVTNGALRCRASDGSGNAQEIINNIEDLQVWYGDRDPLTSNIRYRNAAQVGNLNWGNIGSVMICIRLAGTSRSAPQPAVNNFRGCQNELIPWDGRFRRVYTQVYTLRNPA